MVGVKFNNEYVAVPEVGTNTGTKPAPAILPAVSLLLELRKNLTPGLPNALTEPKPARSNVPRAPVRIRPLEKVISLDPTCNDPPNVTGSPEPAILTLPVLSNPMSFRVKLLAAVTPPR